MDITTIGRLIAASIGIKRQGVYRTEYGSIAYVDGPSSREGWDLENGGTVPIVLMTDEWVREARTGDYPVNRAGW